MAEVTAYVKAGRLAIREEGDCWNAYYAQADTMKDAIFLGSIRLRFVEDPVRKQKFIDLMKSVVDDFIAEATGAKPSWPDGPQPAPEHERGGNA